MKIFISILFFSIARATFVTKCEIDARDAASRQTKVKKNIKQNLLNKKYNSCYFQILNIFSLLKYICMKYYIFQKDVKRFYISDRKIIIEMQIDSNKKNRRPQF